jgi:serine protease Do
MVRISPSSFAKTLAVMSIAAMTWSASVSGLQAAPVPAGPSSVANLAEGLLGAVVNISISQNVKSEGEGPLPNVPEGAPFEEFFNDFFKNKDNQGNRTVNSLGSGFVIDPDGYIVTNNHVIEGADDIEVNFADGTTLKAKLIGTDTKTDLSLLKVEPKKKLAAVHFGDSRVMRIGDWVMAIGNPFGLGGTVTLGIISARGRNINAGPYDNFIQTDAAINKGNSGGPLFNMNGEVIGINTAIISPSGGSIGIGFAVPSEIAENVIQQIREFGDVHRGWLGVRILPVTTDIADTNGLPDTQGAMIAGVIKGGPVDDGTIKAGDIILSFDGKPIHEMRDLPRIVAESPVGKEVAVEIVREGKKQTVNVKLGQLTAAQEAAANAEDDQQQQTDEGAETDNDKGGDKGGDKAQDDGSGDEEDQTGILGISLAELDDDAREVYKIAPSVEGVVISDVDPGSAAAEKGLKTGDVIVEIAQDFVSNPQAVADKLQELIDEGRRNAYMMIASPNGDLRLVAVPLE